ncbi:pfs domain-containing protein [Colletotrichum plurivorum]|uniref:Pfs domain-containing protein n=1 Tax=Colletotrichum plurivorum TaxID=2175906 RepID=A0A8H6J581_9PEZI|nr:pfs domain-containing protein [Colletotrichum plurivorum]
MRRLSSIIAVHGLGSNVNWSWTWKDGEKHINWLRDPDMLPARVRKSRIMTYSYQSKWHKDAPKTRLQLCGEELIHSIHSFGSGTSKRPIVFVGHSLGGNVIVHALLHASDGNEYKDLLEATVGIVFLGMPLWGTKWQPFVDSLAQLMGPAGSHCGITKELEFDGTEVRDKLHRFCRLCNRLSMPVSCFLELYETDYGQRFGLPGVMKGMVCEFS